MLSLKELNKAINAARDTDNIKLIHDVMCSYPSFEEAITKCAAAGEREGTYVFNLPEEWAHKKMHNARDLIEKELNAQYAPIMITVECDTINMIRHKPTIGVVYIIPGDETPYKAEEYGYQMKERGNWE